jgi:ABC-2 type transport system permease protein
MFKHAFVYNLKTILRERETVFWSLIFSLLLATLFYFAFGNLAESVKFETIDIGLVESPLLNKGTQFHSVLSSVSDADGKSSEDDLFRVMTGSAEEAEEWLKNGRISGYIYYDGGIHLVVSGSGFNQTIIKTFLDEYNQTTQTVKGIIQDNPAALFKTITDVMNRKDFLIQTDASPSGGDMISTFFYALLAMSCLIASTSSVYEITKLQANLSTLAARINCSPVRKFKLFLYNISASLFFQIIVVLIVLAYVMLVLGINFGERTGLIILTCIMGTITGVFFGTATGVLGKSEGMKTAITIGGTLFSCFLAGLMANNMKYFVQENMPIVRYISPANLITDAFYSLYYYDTLNRFWLNIAILGLISLVFCTITCLVLRRRTYASI